MHLYCQHPLITRQVNLQLQTESSHHRLSQDRQLLHQEYPQLPRLMASMLSRHLTVLLMQAQCVRSTSLQQHSCITIWQPWVIRPLNLLKSLPVLTSFLVSWLRVKCKDDNGAPIQLNERITQNLWTELITPLMEPCKSAAETLLCHYAFPSCSWSVGQPSLKPLCREDCIAVRDLFCFNEWAMVENNVQKGIYFKSRGHFRLPVCESLPSHGNSTTDPPCTHGGLTSVKMDEVTYTCIKGRGRFYQGSVNKTKTGIPCQRWDAQTPHNHNRPPFVFPEIWSSENYCRNAGGEEPLPWCYTSDPKVRWQHCNIPMCGQCSLFLGMHVTFSTILIFGKNLDSQDVLFHKSCFSGCRCLYDLRFFLKEVTSVISSFFVQSSLQYLHNSSMHYHDLVIIPLILLGRLILTSLSFNVFLWSCMHWCLEYSVVFSESVVSNVFLGSAFFSGSCITWMLFSLVLIRSLPLYVLFHFRRRLLDSFPDKKRYFSCMSCKCKIFATSQACVWNVYFIFYHRTRVLACCVLSFRETDLPKLHYYSLHTDNSSAIDAIDADLLEIFSSSRPKERPVQHPLNNTLLLVLSCALLITISLLIVMTVVCCQWRAKARRRSGYETTGGLNDLAIDLSKLPSNIAYHCTDIKLNPKLEALEYPRNDIIYIRDIGQGAFGRVFQVRIFP